MTEPQTTGVTIQATKLLRWFRPYPKSEKVLQQAWSALETGEIVWRDVPTEENNG